MRHVPVPEPLPWRVVNVRLGVPIPVSGIKVTERGIWHSHLIQPSCIRSLGVCRREVRSCKRPPFSILPITNSSTAIPVPNHIKKPTNLGTNKHLNSRTLNKGKQLPTMRLNRYMLPIRINRGLQNKNNFDKIKQIKHQRPIPSTP